jgi:hypothetical protein
VAVHAFTLVRYKKIERPHPQRAKYATMTFMDHKSPIQHSPIGLTAELCLFEIILLLAERAAARNDTSTLNDLEDYITEVYLNLGYTETDFIVTLHEYVEALRMLSEGKDAQTQREQTKKLIMKDLQNYIINAPDSTPFKLKSKNVIGVYGVIGKVTQ